MKSPLLVEGVRRGPREDEESRVAHPAAATAVDAWDAAFAKWTMSAILMFSFMDRYIVSAVKEDIKSDFGLDDYQTALPATAMTFVFMVSAVLFGWLADQRIVKRKRVLAIGILVWSVATGLAGFAQNLPQLIVMRSLVGVGEAAYGTISVPMLADIFPERDRPRVFLIYSLAVPLGGALGFALGSVTSSSFGWRNAFLICGLPGSVMALIVLWVKDPADFPAPCTPSVILHRSLSRPTSGPLQKTVNDFRDILTNSTFMVVTAGLVCICFALGGFADFIESFFIRYQHSSQVEAGLVIGGITVFGGISGSALGKVAANHYADRCHNAFLLVPALFAISGSFCALVCVNHAGDKLLGYAMFFAAQTLIWTYSVPTTCVTLAAVEKPLRAQACGLQIFLTHALGDVVSPPIIGLISDKDGGLQSGLQICWVAVLVAGLVWLAGWWKLTPLSRETQ
ncbi:unnamed protein product [Prorocentrum cordatum]|uniref:Major facilitator superfamily (MFS) profile domain-containing protein n=1 Tax=Prorocentrum cordatum TaxID=2364126 RepID=A0ABN9W8W4_9DINO|nr:unnamed protein product [Polarella glacialis]